MRTGLPEKKHLQSGDKCRILIPENKYSGTIAIFLNKSLNGNFLFKSWENQNEIIVCHDETQFAVLPTESQLKAAIDLCLDLGWKDMFKDFSNQLLEGEYNNQSYEDISI